MSIGIVAYDVICNLGVGIDSVFQSALCGDNSLFNVRTDLIKDKSVRVAEVKADLPKICDERYNTRCNRLILKTLEMLEDKISKYDKNELAVVVATTNTGVEEYETTNLSTHFELGNPARFIKDYLGLNNFITTVSTACSSGAKAFSIARDLLKSGVSKGVLVVGVDSLSKLPLFGFDSLGVLSSVPALPFSQNRAGINIGEGVATFILEKDVDADIEILGIGETSDVYHSTCPDPQGKEPIKAIKLALNDAKKSPDEIDYINLHGTGTVSNDLMEANSIYEVFKDKVFCSSTKSLTGHCLGASACVELALCCKLIQYEGDCLYPHIFDKVYDEALPKIKLVNEKDRKQVRTCLSTSFGFGGTNTAIVIGGKDV